MDNDELARLSRQLVQDENRRRQVEAELQQSRDQLEAILQGITNGITVQRPDGELIYANRMAAEIMGFPSAKALVATPVGEIMKKFEVMDETGNPFPRHRLPGRLALLGQQPEEALMRFRVVETGEEHWSIVNATPVFAGEAEGSEGAERRVLFAVNIFHDVTERIGLFEAERAARQQAEENAGRIASLQTVTAALSEALVPSQVAAVVLEQGLAVLEAQAGAVALVTEGGKLLELVHAAGYEPDVILKWQERGGVPVSSPLPIAEAAHTSTPVFLSVRRQAIARYASLDTLSVPEHETWAAIPLAVEGQTIGAMELSFANAREFTEEERSFMLALGRQCSQALERARLYEAERVARIQADAAYAEADVARRRLEFLARASAILARSLDHAMTLRRVARLAVPWIADWCAVDLLQEDGTLERVAVTHVDPAKVELAYELQRRYPPDPDSPRGPYYALRTGQPELQSDITDELLVAAARDEEHLRLLRELDLKSYMTVPLRLHDRMLGTLSFVSAESNHHFDAEDLALAEELANRAALAVENARLYRQASQLNEELEERVAERTADLEEANAQLEEMNALLEEEIVERERAEEGIRLQAARTEALVRTAARLNAQLDLETVLAAVCEETARALNVPVTTVSLYDRERQLLVHHHGYGLPPEVFQQLQPMPRRVYDEFAEQMGPMIIIADVQALAELPNSHLYEELNLRSTVSVSMIREGLLIGRINIGTIGQTRQFTENELALLQGLAGQAALAIANAREITERRQAEEAVRGLLHLSERLNVTLDVDELLDLLTAEAIKLVDAGAGLSGLYTAEGLVTHRYFEGSEAIAFEYCWPKGHGIPGWIIEHKRPYLTNDAPSDLLLVPELKKRFNFRSILSVPILDNEGALIGFFEVFNKHNDAGFTLMDQEKLVAISQVAAIAIQNALAFRKIQQAEEALRYSEARLAGILDIAHEAIISVDEQQRIIIFNQGAEQVFSYNAQEVLGLPLSTLIPERFQARHQQHIEQFGRSPIPARRMAERQEIFGRRQNGQEFPAEASISKLLLHGQHYFTVVLRDITERKAAEETIRRNEAQLAEAQRIARLGSWRWDVTNNSVTWSDELYQIFGLRPEEFGASYEGFLERVHPDDRAHAVQQIEAAFQSHEPFNFYHRIVRPDGSIRHLQARGRVILDDNGAVVSMVGTGQDITDLKEVEAQQAQRARQLAVLSQMGQEVASTLDLPVVLRRVLDQVAPLVRAETISILLLEAGHQGPGLRFAAGSGPGTAELEGRRLPVTAGVASEVLQTGQAVWVQDATRRDHLFRGVEAKSGFKVRTLLAVPLQVHGEIMGVLEAIHSQPDAFDADDLRLLEAAASWTSIAIGNARQHEHIRRRLEERETLAAISQALSETLELEQMLQRIARTARQVIPHVDLVVIHLFDEEKQQLYPAAAIGLQPPHYENYVLQLGEGFAGRAFAEGRAINAGDVLNDPRHLHIHETLRIQSLLVSPVQSGQRQLGVIGVSSTIANAFSADDERLLSALGAQAALALHNASLYNTLAEDKRRLELLYEQNAQLYEAERHAHQVAETLRTANVALSQTLDLDVILETLLDHLSHLVAYDSASVLLREGRSVLTVRAARGHERWGDPELARQTIFDFQGTANLRQLAATQQGFIIPDTRDYEEWQWRPGSEHVRNWLGVPLVAENRLIGIFALDKAEAGFFAETHLRLVEALSSQAAVAIQNALLYNEVRHGREQLRRLTQQVVSAQEEERQRVARELHDEAGQALTALKISLALVQKDLPVELETLAQRLGQAVDLTGNTMEQIRLLAQDLRPPALDTLGLNSTLEGYCHDFALRTRLVIDYIDQELPPLTGAVSICLYRFLQEALTNVAKHAQASEVQVALRYEDETVSLLVADNGVGFDVQAYTAAARQQSGIGLVGMRERFELLGGWLEIESSPGQGTRLIGHIPWQDVVDN